MRTKTYMLVRIIRTCAVREDVDDEEQEADNIRACLLDAIGYPDGTDYEIMVLNRVEIEQ